MRKQSPVYRFLSYEGMEATIKTEQLRFSNPRTFNDPLDGSYHLFPSRYMMNSSITTREPFESYSVFLSENVYKSVYVCCFSKEYKSKDAYLMWAHYGEKHKNLCFELTWANEENNFKFLGGPEEVKYGNLVDIRNDAERFDKIDLGNYLTHTKSDIWKYEKEQRFLVDLEHKNATESLIPKVEKDYCYVNFDLKMITKVIFGLNSPEDQVKKIISCFLNKSYTPIFVKLFIDTETLELEEKKLSVN
ncbi:DUF2971 domain-containing protein [bacterium]|nr:DUF2971 domain-containing protein [bacterium]